MLLKYTTALSMLLCLSIYANCQSLQDAIDKKDTARAIEMIKHGYNLDSVDAQGTSLLMNYCRYSDDTTVASFLVRHGAKPDYPRSPKGRTPLIIACAYYGGIPLCRVLINAGADVNAITKDGVTSLMMAAQNYKADVIEYLLAKGANPNLKDAKGQTALDYVNTSTLDLDVIKSMKCCKATKQGTIDLLTKAISAAK